MAPTARFAAAPYLESGELVAVLPEWKHPPVPLHPRRSDDLPWDEIASCDAAYFTAQDPDALRAARDASLLVVTARRH